MANKKPKPVIVIRELLTNAAVRPIEVANPTERKLEQLERVLLLNIDLDRFWVDVSQFDDLNDHRA